MFASQPSAAIELQSAWPLLQASPHEVPSHVAVEFGYVVHVVHEAPHVATALLLAQVPPQL